MKESLCELEECLAYCGECRKKLKKCVVKCLDNGAKKEDILLTVDKTIGDDKTSLCGLIALSETLRYEENSREKPLSAVDEYHD